MTSVRLVGVEKAYGPSIAAQVERLDIADGEILTLLGPSGCGKTTTLRIVAGLIRHDRGDLFFGERNMNEVPPEKRNAAMVFQNYALFPHMTVFDNVAFGLVVRKAAKDEIARRVKSALELVKLPGMAERYPRQLSGGQQQRIAIARALATDPDVLLFDEPLSNLDAKLREYMRFELRKLLDELKITTVYVTHDQTEAMVVSNRIAVMDKGRVVQIDTPHNVYRRPASRFVADFLGLSSFVTGKVKAVERSGADQRYVVVADDGLTFAGTGGDHRAGDGVTICIRPENVTLAANGAGGVNVFDGKVVAATDLGEFIDYQVAVGNWVLRTKTLANEGAFAPGAPIKVRLDPAGCAVVSG